MAKHDPTLDALFKALADPTRRGMAETLLRGPATVSALAEEARIALPTALKHLAVLAEAGLVATEKSGRTRLCRATPAPLSAAESWIDAQRRVWESRLDRLEDYLATLPKDPAP